MDKTPGPVGAGAMEATVDLPSQYGRKNLAAALWESEERFRNLLEHLHEPIRLYEMDGEGKLIFAGANKAADRLFKVDHDLLVGRRVEDTFPSFAETEILNLHLSVLKTGRPWEGQAAFFEDGALLGYYNIDAFPVSPRLLVVMLQETEEPRPKYRNTEGSSRGRGPGSDGRPFFELHVEKGDVQQMVEGMVEGEEGEEPLSPLAIVRPGGEELRFTDLFELEELQRLQDAWASATGIASIICEPDGRPITKPSNFCRLCDEVVRQTPRGKANCMASDAYLGRPNPSGPLVSPCLSSGLLDAGASICVGNKHIGSWLIGQVRNEELSDEAMLAYARKIGADEGAFMEALVEVPRMSKKQFHAICDALFLFANQMSELALQNVLQARNLVARREAEAALRRSRARLHRLSAKLIMAQEEERRQLAVELHDGIGQSLTAAKYCVDNVTRVLASGGSVGEALESASNVLKSSINDVRRMQAELRPQMLDEMGVVSTLNWFCREYQSIYRDVKLKGELDVEEGDIPPVLRPVIFRISQEALNNSAKHSGAKNVRLSLVRGMRGLVLQIEDDGRGFNLPEVLADSDWRRGLGLESMRERTELMGGVFRIETKPGQGTKVTARWRD